MEILIIGAMGGLFATLLAPPARARLLTTSVDRTACSHRRSFQPGGHRNQGGRLLAEAVAGSLCINLSDDRQADWVKQVYALTATNRASMFQDILRGIPTPVNLLLTRLIKALEATASHRIEPFFSSTSSQESPCTRKS